LTVFIRGDIREQVFEVTGIVLLSKLMMPLLSLQHPFFMAFLRHLQGCFSKEKKLMEET